jgi:hypothetical protein
MFELSDIAVATKGGICHYGVQESRFRLQPERLAYVVFVDNESNVSVSQTGGSNGQRTYLTVWNHLEIELPGEHQLYEIINGKLQTRDERVSLVELGDYLTSEKDRPSLAALVNHAKALRAKK